MPSSVSAGAIFERWNRKLHYYIGLYFLFFLWLFLLTGLMLNHGPWFQIANDRRETRTERTVQVPPGGSDLERARDAARQLGLVGEIELPTTAQPPNRFDFNIARPKDASTVRIDLTRRTASIQHFDNGGWAVFRIFHTFSGSRYNAPGERDWILTTMWAIAMDALAAGLIVMVLGSYYMWYQLKRTHTLGWIALAAGFTSCAMFLVKSN